MERNDFVRSQTDERMCATHELVEQVHRHLRVDGGFTVHSRTGHPARHGLAVCADPRATLSFAAREWEPTVVARWLDRHRRHRWGSFLGGWFEPHSRRVVLDVVHVLPYAASSAARALGRAHRQQAIFDLGACRLLCLDDDAAFA